MDTIVVNGPEDVLDWDAIDWRAHEDNVARLRRRIFTATRERDWATVRSLQKMMLRSWSNTLVCVRQVTQRNAGRRTAGIDGEVALSSPQRAALAVRVHRSRVSWDPLPVRRVYPRARLLPPQPAGAATQEPDTPITRNAPGACLSRGAGKARSPGSEGAPARQRAGATRQIELSFDEIETHQTGHHRVLRSKTPQLVKQEIWALLLTHYAIRHIMKDAADTAGTDPDDLSFIRSYRAIRRQVTNQAGFSP